jgi:uncharacterized protein YbjQ (UPF0145 family)
MAAEPPGGTDEREQTESLARIEAGDIPLQAKRRLGGLRESGGSYTSDLSTADFALCRQVGLRPLAQVMGSSIYQVGYQQSVGWMGLGRRVEFAGGLVTELDTLTDAWNEARTRALDRLAREAQIVGADAVVGVDLHADASDWADSTSSGVIQYSVIGTAVRRERVVSDVQGFGGGKRPRDQQPVLTELAVADYAKLVSADIEPAGIVGWSSVVFSAYGFGTAIRAQPGVLTTGQESFELREFTQAIYAARERVMERMGAQAQSSGASGIVGVRISHSMNRQSLGQSAGSGLVVTFHAIGTAVHDAADTRPAAPKPTIDLTS